MERIRATPQLYIKPEHRQALEAFQEQIKEREAGQAIDELERILEDRRKNLLENVRPGREGLRDILKEVKNEEDQERVERALQKVRGKGDRDADMKERVKAFIAVVKDILADRHQKVIEDLRRRVRQAEEGKYLPDDPKFRMLHLGYLEARFPHLYEESLAWQEFPLADVKTVLAAWEGAQKAYRTNDADRFDAASQKFMDTVKTVSEHYGPYPGTIHRDFGFIPVDYGLDEMMDYEITLNQVEPFQKAWIIMLLSLGLFIASMALPAGRAARVCYVLAFVPYLVALGFQIFGFTLRVIIAGRPPVSNLYETLVWVSFMSAVFALILELIYRKKVIGLAGTVVATLGLVMADQLTITFDPKISPLLPVLRTNYWLIIHVLTIVSSYAGGTLAWGVGNISLAIMAFGKGRRDVVKTLAQFTYRAMQIAVLLLAFGTFLGGMWAAESWGRFWGWDPKEVWALIALVCYVIPLHARYVGWVKDFGLAVAAVVCYAAIVVSWYLFSALGGGGLHAYAMSGGGPIWVFWGAALNILWVLVASLLYVNKDHTATPLKPEEKIVLEHVEV